jgi:hypothetical protein
VREGRCVCAALRRGRLDKPRAPLGDSKNACIECSVHSSEMDVSGRNTCSRDRHALTTGPASAPTGVIAVRARSKRARSRPPFKSTHATPTDVDPAVAPLGDAASGGASACATMWWRSAVLPTPDGPVRSTRDPHSNSSTSSSGTPVRKTARGRRAAAVPSRPVDAGRLPRARRRDASAAPTAPRVGVAIRRGGEAARRSRQIWRPPTISNTRRSPHTPPAAYTSRPLRGAPEHS